MRIKSLLSFFATVSVFSAFFYFFSPFCNAKTDGFSLVRIHSELPYENKWESPPLSAEQTKELETALSQPFHYLACGGQCFAFVSEDEHYVIKFFKHRIRKPYSYFYYSSLPQILDGIRKRKLAKAHFKLSRDFNSYKMAYENLREETGLLYIHLNKQEKTTPPCVAEKTIHIFDKLGIAHQIKLDDIEFVVQKRAQLAYAHIDEQMQTNDLAAARESLRSIIHVIAERCKKGIFDEDPKIHRNLGFVGQEPIFIDVGRFTIDPSRKNPAVYHKDIRYITKRLRYDLEESHPSLVPILQEEIDAFENTL